MNFPHLTPTLVAALMTAACASAPPADTSHPPVAAATSVVAALERDIEAAQIRGDTQFIERATTADLRFTHGGAPEAQTREQWLRGVLTSTFYEREGADQRVELHGNVAVTTGRIRVRRQHAEPTRAEYTIWYVRVYRFDASAWRLLSHQTVRSTLPTG